MEWIGLFTLLGLGWGVFSEAVGRSGVWWELWKVAARCRAYITALTWRLQYSWLVYHTAVRALRLGIVASYASVLTANTRLSRTLQVYPTKHHDSQPWPPFSGTFRAYFLIAFLSIRGLLLDVRVSCVQVTTVLTHPLRLPTYIHRLP